MNLRGNHGELVTDTIKQVYRAIKSTASYPGDHPTSRHIVANSYETLAALLDRRGSLTVCVFGLLFKIGP
jgi:hypothetical protein